MLIAQYNLFIKHKNSQKAFKLFTQTHTHTHTLIKWNINSKKIHKRLNQIIKVHFSSQLVFIYQASVVRFTLHSC